jgi:hypothetical protein
MCHRDATWQRRNQIELDDEMTASEQRNEGQVKKSRNVAFSQHLSDLSPFSAPRKRNGSSRFSRHRPRKPCPLGNRPFLRSRNRAVSDRLKPFTLDELHALVFRLDIAETVEPLDEVAERLRDEMVKELELRKK